MTTKFEGTNCVKNKVRSKNIQETGHGKDCNRKDRIQ